MGVPATKRLSNYEQGLNPDHIKDVVTAKKTAMVAFETSTINEQTRVEDITHAVLASEGAVHTIQIPAYLAFSKEVMSLKARMTGGAPLNNEVAVILAKWKARNLTESILIKIRNQVFSIPAPAAP